VTTPADPAALPPGFDGLVLGSEAADAAAWREEPDRAQPGWAPRCPPAGWLMPL